MTKQEIFNKVWDHFIVNKGKRSTDGMTCRYRDDDGNKCAVGVLIPDELYSCSMEGGNIIILFDAHTSFVKYIGRENRLLLSNLQNVHDDSHCWSNGSIRPEHLRGVAKKHNLTIPTTKQKETTNEKKLTIDHSNYNIPRLVLHG